MLHRISLSLLVASLPLGLMACQEQGLTADELAPSNVPAFTVHFAYPSPGTRLSPEEVEHRATEGRDMMLAVHDIARQSSDWRDADRFVRSARHVHPDFDESKWEQAAGVFMFRTYFQDMETLSNDQREALAYYTDRLVENRSPEVVLIADAIERLGGHWSEAKRAEVAASAADAAEAFLARRLDCTDCPADQVLRRLDQDTRAREDRFLIEAAEATRRLRALSAEIRAE